MLGRRRRISSSFATLPLYHFHGAVYRSEMIMMHPIPFVNTHFPEPHARPPSSHPYRERVGGKTFTLMTEWDDLLLAVRCCWEPPNSQHHEAGFAASGSASSSASSYGSASASGSASSSAPAPMKSVDDFFQALCHAFHVHRAAILVSIRSRRLALFLPFANERYTMPRWQMKELDLPRSGSEYARLKQANTGSRQVEPMIEDPARWWFNGHVVCNVMPDNVWGDYQMRDLCEMIEYTLSKFPIPDTDFLLNKRDCPLLLKIRTRAPYLPVLSPYTGPAALDISFPLADDWRKATAAAAIPPAEWASRKDARAVFRGSSTGIGVDETTNVRLALAMFASSHRLFLDVAITSINDRDQIQGRAVVHPRVADLKKRLVDAGVFGKYESLEEQAARYKFAIYIRGHQAASRLASLFANGFLVLYFAPRDEPFDVPGCKTWLDEVLADAAYDGWKGGGAGKGAGQVAAQPVEPEAEAADSVSKLLSALGGKRKRARPAAKGVGSSAATSSMATSSAAPRSTTATPTTSLPSSIRVGVVSSEHSGLGTPPLPHHSMCRCGSLEELVECVRFMQANDDIARVIAAQGYERIGRNMLTRDAIASCVRNALVASVSAHISSPWDETTHALFGISNIDYVSKGLLRKIRS